MADLYSQFKQAIVDFQNQLLEMEEKAQETMDPDIVIQTNFQLFPSTN